MDPKYVRKDAQTEDKGSSDAIEYNVAAGAKKTIAGGHHLRPVQTGAATWSCDITAVVKIGAGKTLAVYNNAATVGSITFGKDNTTTSLAAGAVGGPATNPNVGHACTPNAWTYFNSYDRPWAIASAATLLCYIVEDSTYITDQNNPTQI